MCQTAAEACRHARLDPFNLPLRNAGRIHRPCPGKQSGWRIHFRHVHRGGGAIPPRGARFSAVAAGRSRSPSLAELIDTVRAETPLRGADSPDVAINMVAGTISKAFGLIGAIHGRQFRLRFVAAGDNVRRARLATGAHRHGDCRRRVGLQVRFAGALLPCPIDERDRLATLRCRRRWPDLLRRLRRACAQDPRSRLGRRRSDSGRHSRTRRMSCDGRGKSLWAPRKEGQVKAMARAYRNGLDMATLQYIEAHATSTNLGDATELNALAEILAAKFPPGKKIPITQRESQHRPRAGIGRPLERHQDDSLPAAPHVCPGDQHSIA